MLRSLIGSTAEEVARRLGLGRDGDRIVEIIDRGSTDRSPRVITDIGLDELSLKAASALRDVNDRSSDPTRPQILAVERGRDTTATLNAWIGSRRNNANRSAPIGSTWGRLSGGVRPGLPHSRAVTDRFHVAKKFNEVVDSCENITREYKAKLTKDQRKAFRSQMWAFRRDPESLSAEGSKRWRPSWSPGAEAAVQGSSPVQEILIQRRRHGRC